MDILLNGLTLQYVGQILLPGQENDAAVIDHHATFKCCLEDFTFAMLCGERLLVSGQMPPRGGREPGARVADYFHDNVSLIGPSDAKRPETLLLDKPARALLRARLSHFDEVMAVGRPYLRDWIIPEAEADFGEDPSVLDDDLPAGEYVFGKAPPYMVDRNLHMVDGNLQDAIPKRVITELSGLVLEALRRRKPSNSVARSAVDEFVSRCILTHLVIDIWYNGVFRATQPRSTKFLPFITRRLNLRAASRPLAQVLMPHVLLDVLRDSPPYSPGSFAAVLLEKRKSPNYQKLRELFAELSCLDVTKRHQSEERLQKAINEMIERARLPSLPVGLEPDEWCMDLADLENYRQALKGVAKPLELLETFLGRVFPLLSTKLKGQEQMTIYNNYGQVTAMGTGATVTNAVQNKVAAPPEIDVAALARELARLEEVMVTKSVDTNEQIAALDAIVEAKRAAIAGDGSAAIASLAKGGKWALTVATAVGTGIVVAALKSALGL